MLKKTTAYGLEFFYPASDTAVGPCLAQYGEFSVVLLDLLIDLTKQSGPSTFVDVGANLGSISLPFAKKLTDWKVTCIEAHSGLAGLLQTNALLNELYNVDVIHAAAGPAREIAEFPATSLMSKMNFGTISIGYTSSPSVPTVMLTLDEISPADTKLIRIDVEDFEPQVMQGAQRLLNAQNVTWIVEAAVNFPQTTLKTVKIFLDAGYDVYWFYVPFATPKSTKDKPSNPLVGDANIVAQPKGSPNIWDLPKINIFTDPRPGSLAGYPYLLKYGYR